MGGKSVLDNLLGEEQSLREKAKMLKRDLEGLNSKMVSKQNQVDLLLAEVAELKLGKRQCKLPNEEDNAENGIKLVNERDIEPERLAETILLEEIWREIFGKMDGLDLLNASQACQHFHNILGPLKNNFLFEKVLPILLLYNINLSDVLKCRLVSKDWRSAINSFYEGEAKLMGFSHPNSIHGFVVISKKDVDAYNFSRYLRDPNNFLQKFNPARNPFITNTISIFQDEKPEYSEEEVKFCKGIDTILETFGRHIRHFRLIADLPNRSPGLATAELLHKLFSKAQNLQTLDVDEYRQVCDDEADDYFAQFEIEELMNSMPSLETLNVNMSEHSPIPNWLFRNFHLQIKKLHLRHSDCLVHASRFSWPKVTDLGFDSSFGDDECKGYRNYLESFPSLKKLHLSTGINEEIPKVLHDATLLPTIFPRLHTLQLSICSIYYYYPSEEESFHRDAIILNTPEELEPRETLDLKILTNYVPQWCGDFAFLLRYPFIKRLNIIFKPNRICYWDRKVDNLEIVELYEYLATNSHPRSSNVWRMLPNLETLQLQNKIYKRPKPFCTKRE